MIILRQKNFGKISFRKGQKVVDGVKGAYEKSKPGKWADKNKSTIGIITGISGTALGTANLSIALKRSQNEKKFQKEQIDATKKLTDAIENSNQEELKKNKKLVKKSQKPYTRNYYLPKPVEDLKDKSLETINIKRKS